MGETGLNHRQIHHILPSSGGWETKSADYLNNVNPAGTVPVLVHNGHPIYESHEQIVYIDQVLMPGGHSISKGSSRIHPLRQWISNWKCHAKYKAQAVADLVFVLDKSGNHYKRGLL